MKTYTLRAVTRSLFAILLVVVVWSTASGDPPVLRQRLGSYNVDISQSSVSGFSGGGYMSAQFFTAFSDHLVGAGILGAGPYGCSRANLSTALGKCMSYMPRLTASDIDQIYETAKGYDEADLIDPLDNLQNRKLYIFSGTLDQTVKQEVSDWIDDWFEKAGMPSENILYKKDLAAGHSHPTSDYGNSCNTISDSPWMGDCDYDGAGASLNHIYGSLNAASPVTDTSGTFIEFPQNEFFESGNLTKPQLKERYSFNEFGYAYVPSQCQDQEPCRIHVVFHGCKQIYDRNPDTDNPDDTSNPFGLQMVKHAGYNEWANSNNFIILYPQAQRTAATSFIGGFGNPKGCFDWWAYIDGTADTYATRKGPQMAAVFAMMEKIAGAPSAEFDKAEQQDADLVIEGSVSDENDAIEGLKVEFLFEENRSTGLKTVDEFNMESGKFKHNEAWPQDRTAYGVRLLVEYTDKPPYAISGPKIMVGNNCQEWTTTNAIHRSEGRAARCWFFFNCAAGSNDFLGFNTTTTTVRKEEPDNAYFKQGGCEE